MRFGFCVILNNQGLSKIINLSLRLQLITLTSTLIILDITEISSNNCLLTGQVSPSLTVRTLS